MKYCSVVLVFAAVLAGCVGDRGVRYENGGTIYICDADELSYSELNTVADQAVQRLLTDPLFSKRYQAAQAHARSDGRDVPGLIVDPIENNVNNAGDESTEQMRTILKDALRKTGKFEIVDRNFRNGVVAGHIESVDQGESAVAISGIGSFVPGEFVIKGEVTRYKSKSGKRNIYHHNVNFKMIDSIRGDLFWTTIISIDKSEVSR